MKTLIEIDGWIETAGGIANYNKRLDNIANAEKSEWGDEDTITALATASEVTIRAITPGVNRIYDGAQSRNDSQPNATGILAY